MTAIPRMYKEHLADFCMLMASFEHELTEKFGKLYRLEVSEIQGSNKSTDSLLFDLMADKVFEAVCQAWNITLFSLTTKNRETINTDPRKAAMKILRERCPSVSLKRIGGKFGGRDHSTVLWAVKACDNLIETDERYKKRYNVALSLLQVDKMI